MGGKSKAPAAPDYTPIANADEQAASLQQQTANNQLAWAQQQFAINQNEVNPIIQQEKTAAQQQQTEAQTSYNRYINTEVPLQNQYLAQAESYSNPSKQQELAGTAISNANQGFVGARNQAQQQLSTYGADPGTARSLAQNQQLSSQQAAAAGAAGTASTLNTQQTGLGLEANAENMLAGLPAQSGSQYSGANTSGNSASGNALGLTSSGAATEGTGVEYSGLAANSLNNWGNTLSTAYNDQLQGVEYNNAVSGSLLSGIGSLIGEGVGGYASTFAKGGAIPQRLAHGGMAIPDMLAKGGPAIPRSAMRVPAFHVSPNHMKNSKPIAFHLLAAGHPHTASVGAGGTPRMSSGVGMPRGLGGGEGMGMGSAYSTPGAGKDGGVPGSIDNKNGGLPTGGMGGSGNSGYASGGGIPMALAEGGALPVQPGDPHGRADNVPVKTQAGAYVVPKSVVDKKGSHFFDKIIAEHGSEEEKKAAHMRLLGMHTGVDPQGGQGNAHILMSGGEFMMPKSVVQKLGTHHFDKIAAKEGDATDRKAAELRLQGQQAGAGNGPPVPPNQLRTAIPRVDLKSAIPMGGMQ